MQSSKELSLVHDGRITIAVAKSRTTKKWKNKEMLWSELVSRLSTTTRTRETLEEYKNMSKAQQDDVKDVGGFVGGTLKEGRRKAENVVWRQIITLDADYARGDMWAGVEAMLGCACVMYSTHKHSSKNPRLRFVIPLKRAVTADEYPAVARRIAADIGIDFFDDTTYEPHRLMYWPSTSADGEFVSECLDEPWLDPDEMLARYPDWRDPSYWPESSRGKARRDKMAEKQGDPRQKPGIVGAFCRTYTVPEVIEEYLSDIYQVCEDPNRYTYAPGTSAGGLVIYENGDFAYSHHGTDPVSGQLCNAFDLVRIHKFGAQDEEAKPGTPVSRLPSYIAMQQLATKDKHVKKQVVADQLDQAVEDFNDEESSWESQLEVNTNGQIKDSLSNMVLILKNDPALQGIAFNEHRDSIDVDGDAPWKRIKEGWGKSDEAGLAYHVERNYKIWSPGKCRDALLTVSMDRSFHPVRDYLDNLPAWDGRERVDELLIKYLAAEDTAYTRAVTRKTFCAAVARVYEPGIKFDSMLVLNGPQGIGKSTLFARLAGSWFSDSLTISDMRDKTAAEKLQGYWIVEIGELAGIRKIDVETVKSFLSRQDDKYRASYGYQVESHPRQCIIVGSTNSEHGFLRDITGNRRFWPVRVHLSREKPWDIKDEEVDQIWAEAAAKYMMGENLFLDPVLEKQAEMAQKDALETDEREGIIREYLDMPLPERWDYMDIYERRNYLRGEDFIGELEGVKERDRVCILEIWCELFGKDPSTLRRQDAYELNAMMRKIDGWVPYPGSKSGILKFPIYGNQRAFIRSKFG